VRIERPDVYVVSKWEMKERRVREGLHLPTPPDSHIDPLARWGAFFMDAGVSIRVLSSG
jgi:hypothetical protein